MITAVYTLIHLCTFLALCFIAFCNIDSVAK